MPVLCAESFLPKLSFYHLSSLFSGIVTGSHWPYEYYRPLPFPLVPNTVLCNILGSEKERSIPELETLYCPEGVLFCSQQSIQEFSCSFRTEFQKGLDFYWLPVLLQSHEGVTCCISVEQQGQWYLKLAPGFKTRDKT